LGTGEHYGRIKPAAYYVTGRLLVPAVIFGVAQSLNLPPAFSLLNEAALDKNRPRGRPGTQLRDREGSLVRGALLP
jgi:hypothetical protein